MKHEVCPNCKRVWTGTCAYGEFGCDGPPWDEQQVIPFTNEEED